MRTACPSVRPSAPGLRFRDRPRAVARSSTQRASATSGVSLRRGARLVHGFEVRQVAGQLARLIGECILSPRVPIGRKPWKWSGTLPEARAGVKPSTTSRPRHPARARQMSASTPRTGYLGAHVGLSLRTLRAAKTAAASGHRCSHVSWPRTHTASARTRHCADIDTHAGTNATPPTRTRSPDAPPPDNIALAVLSKHGDRARRSHSRSSGTAPECCAAVSAKSRASAGKDGTP